MNMIRRAILALALAAGIFPAIAQVPPPVPALPDTERRTSYTISGSTCACGVGFALYGDSTDYQNWLTVWINGVQVAYNDPNFGWTITSPTGQLGLIPRPVTNGILTFNKAVTGTVQIVGARRPRRTSQFQEGRSVTARDLNQLNTDIIAVQREVWDRQARTLQSQPGVALSGLPLPSTCANSYFVWDATGTIPGCSPGAVATAVATSIGGNSGAFTLGNGLSLTGFSIVFAPIPANSVWSNWTSSTAAPTANTWPACAADGAHAYTYTNGTGPVCTLIAVTTPSYPDFWNGSFSVWQRGTVFSFTGGTQTPNFGQYTADYTSGGAGSGGVATVQKYTLNAIEMAAITPSINPPSTGMRMTFSTKPTAGGGASQVGYPNYASYIELKGNNAPNYAGKQVTVSAWIRGPTSATYKFYLYAALGGLTNTNSSVSTISGTGAGCDYASGGNTEIFCRSAQLTTAVGPTWQRFSYTLTLDNLQAATIGSNTVVNIGVGFDYTDMVTGQDFYITALNLDYGPTAQPWREWPDEAKYALAMYNFQWVGAGAVGYAFSTTSVTVSIPFKGVIKSNGSSGGGLGSDPTIQPIISCSNGSTFTGSGSTFSYVAGTGSGMLVAITGFTGLTSGNTCILRNDWLYSNQG